jgi:6-pyruvoyltetrahydropterin/6-carboxytetrahydropterin synthase
VIDLTMYLTANRRMTFAASRRFSRDRWTRDENERLYGAGAEGAWGSGENFEAHFVLDGELEPSTGMFVNLAWVKEALNLVLEQRYDHRYLNLDTPPFDTSPPTAENIATELLGEATRACAHLAARPVVCHLDESAGTGATFYQSGLVERDFWMSFSAARRTWSPHLSEAENLERFGRAASPAGHGHGYRLRATLAGPVDHDSGLIVPHETSSRALAALHALLDHRNLNVEVADLAGSPMTTECLARFIFRRLAEDLPVARVRLHETPEIFAEYDGRRVALGLERSFSAAHCLRNPGFTEEENRRVFGKCSNPSGHGHRYRVQATLAGRLDERSGTLFHLGRFEEAVESTLGAWNGRHLDLEVADFHGSPSTGENILRALWPRLDSSLDGMLARLRLFETENNRFTLRLQGAAPTRS